MLDVKSTKNYDQFTSALGNRFLNATHVRKLIASIGKRNYMMYQPILVNDDLCIIDGQHRLAAARHLKAEVHYVILPDADLQTIRALNSNLKAWTVRDFVESYMKTGNKDYEELFNFSNQYGVPLTTAAAILGNNKGDLSGGGAAKAIRDGLFIVTNLHNAHELMKTLKNIEPYSEGAVWISRDFIKAFVMFLDSGGESGRLIEKLKKTNQKIRRQTDYRSYLLLLQDIYNFGQKKEKISIVL